MAQLKGNANRLRMLWRKFHDLVYKQTGFGWDPTTHTITASEDRCAKWANPREFGLRKKGLPHFDLCIEMFSASAATGNIARSSAIPLWTPMMMMKLIRGYEISKSIKRSGTERGQSDHSNKIVTCIDAITTYSEAKTRKLAKFSNDETEDCMRTLSKMEGLLRDLFIAAQDQFVLKVRRQMFLLMSDAANMLG
ncbi:UNVERIFIED_CONTAM: hypothetical protein Sindi_1311400 [Sesamum indicum]